MTRPDESSGLDLQKPIEHFRAKTRRLKIHPQERLVLWIVVAHLVALPWALGAMRLWAQIPSLIVAVIGLAVALVPRNYTEEHTGSNSFRLIMWPKLLRFPLFWLGIALLGLVTIQALNPAWIYKTDGRSWWMQTAAHISWLPSGVAVPFERWGPWRKLMIDATAWLIVCTTWVGFTRRRTLQILFIVLATNGLAVAGLGLAERFLGNGKIYWFFVSPNAQYFASFIYKNHAAAYLDLTLALCCGLAAWYYLRGLRRLEKSSPAGVFAFFSTCIAVAILVSYARGATIAMLGFLIVCTGVFIVHQLFTPSENRKPVVAIALILIFGIFLKTGLDTIHSKEAWTRLKSGLEREDTSLESRELANKASLDAWRENWRMGIGSGSFPFLFPIYQHRYPDLVEKDGRRLFWEHAHNDVLEFPIELGLPGMAIVLAAVGYLGVLLVRSYFWENPLSGCVVFGLGVLVVYSWWDFPFQCPAILVLWWVLAMGAAMWSRFEEAGLRS